MDKNTIKTLGKQILTDAETIAKLSKEFDEGSAMRRASETRAQHLIDFFETYLKPHLK